MTCKVNYVSLLANYIWERWGILTLEGGGGVGGISILNQTIKVILKDTESLPIKYIGHVVLKSVYHWFKDLNGRDCSALTSTKKWGISSSPQDIKADINS